MIRRMIVAVAAVAAATVLGAGSARAATSDPGISALLARSAAAWNRGDLDTFMQNYENAPTTVYISAKGVIRGYAAIRAHYAAHYGHHMGTLGVSDIELRPLDDAYEIVLARWHLALGNGKKLSGPFSLVLHRSSGTWRIVEDCTP